MADISTNMEVKGLSEYKRAMNEAKDAVKTLDSQLKLNEAQYKASGDAEQYMAVKTTLLKEKIEEQAKVAKNAEEALKQMKREGIDSSSPAYQKMRQNMYSATQKLVEMKNELAQVEGGSKKAHSELEGIGKGVAWENVTNGLKTITDQLQSGARAAVNFGKKIAKSAMDSTGWADDVLTRATKYGVDAETIQRMDNVAEFIDTDVDTIMAAKSRLARNKDSLGDLLGLDANGMSLDEAFWEAGKAISAMTDEWEQEDAAQKVFGRGWKELIPLFTAGQEKYQQLMEEQSVLSNAQVEGLGEADDAIKSMQQQIELMKNQFWADNADKIIELMQWILDNKDGIVAALTAIGAAFGLIKVGELSANLMKTVNGLKELGFLGGNKNTPSVNTPKTPSTGGDSTGGASVFSKIGDAVKTKASLLSAGGGMTPFAFLGAEALLGYAGWKMIEANLNDPESNKIYGTGSQEGNSIVESMSDEAAKAAKAYWEVYQDTESEAAMNARDKLFEILGGEGYDYAEQGVSFLENIFDNLLNENDVNDMGERLMKRFGELDMSQQDPLAIPGMVTVPENEAENIAKEIGTVTVMADVVPVGEPEGGFANGLWSVPFDGYHAVLHKGERVVPAREAGSRSFSSNLYVENMNMNGGLSADALAASIASRNRRVMAGFGS